VYPVQLVDEELAEAAGERLAPAVAVDQPSVADYFLSRQTRTVEQISN